MRLTGKVAIITGGARGIGKAYALRLSEEGAKVVIVDVLEGAAVVEEIRARTGSDALSLRMDVSDERSTREMARRTVERFGRIDILVNNAAIFTSVGKKPFVEISGDEWDRVMQVNVKGMFLCCKAVYPQMKKQGKGKIINISSSTFFNGVPYFLHYVTSKGGVIGFTRALAREVGDDGICVNAVAPGLTMSEVLRDGSMYSPDYVRSVANSRCLKRDELPEDLTGTILFLSSDESDFITGQTFLVDGGALFH